MKKKAGVGNIGDEELARFKATVLTRAITRMQAETLFSGANAAKARESRKIDGLFVQAKGAESMSPMLSKTARISGADVPDEIHHSAIPYGVRKKLHSSYLREKANEEPTGYGKAGLTGGAVGGLFGAGMGAISGYHKGGTGKGALVGGAAGALLGGGIGLLAAKADKDAIQHAKTHGRSSSGVDRSIAEHVSDYETRKDIAAERRHQQLLWELRNKTASPVLSKTAAVDAFFEKLADSKITTAQRRYPELLKASAAPGGAGTVKTPTTKKGASTIPAQASISGGAA